MNFADRSNRRDFLEPCVLEQCVIDCGNRFGGITNFSNASLRLEGEFVNPLYIRLNIQFGIFGAGNRQRAADEVDFFVVNLWTNQSRKGFGKPGLALVAHFMMLAEMGQRCLSEKLSPQQVLGNKEDIGGAFSKPSH